ncbi:hypothetical protein BN1013_02312 [Candidatus Rubidus massiliensis]|nr:MAG: hypothetical protein BGO10_05910 [Chlamydia sp. 32-24]CDZ81776.1 hypothetical protein BN1013_02312 [Candidatus Rubidus massiliensis]
MRKLLITGLLMTSCFTSTFAIDMNKKIEYSLPTDTKWKETHRSENEQITIIQYAPENDSKDNLHEVVTLMHLSGVPIPLKDYFDLFVQELSKSGPKNGFQHKILDQNENSLTGEWWIKNGSKEDQHEWIKLFKDGNDLAIIRYTTKKTDSKSLENGKKIISEAKLTKN